VTGHTITGIVLVAAIAVTVIGLLACLVRGGPASDSAVEMLLHRPDMEEKRGEGEVDR
jgi:hypothetical protein